MADQDHSPLEVVIVGAGVAGLASAIALRRAGHNITIIEKSSMKNEVGAAIHVCPNAARVVLPWGLNPSKFVVARSWLISRGDNLQPILDTSYARIEETYGAACYYAHRVDLHDELKRLALGADGLGKPAQIRLGTTVFEYDPLSGVLKLSDGSEVRGDLVVGADGVHSTAVEVVNGNSIPAVPSGFSCFRFLLDSPELLNDPETAPLINGNDGILQVFVNSKHDRGRLVLYPCRNNKVQNIALIYGDEDEKVDLEDWNNSATQEILLRKMKGFHPSLIAVCKKANDIKTWKLLSREPLPTWHRSRLVVIGDAAHPMLPHHAQGGAQAIEDGAALGKLFENFYSKDADSISQRLDLFEKIRKNRASAIQVFSSRGQDQVEMVLEAASKYVPDGNLPRDAKGFQEFNYGPDVVRACERELAVLAAA